MEFSFPFAIRRNEISQQHFDGEQYSPSINGPIVGTPEDVAREIEKMTKTIHTTHLVLGMHMPGLDPAKSQRSMALFAQEVMSALR